MAKVIHARYENDVLKPLEKLDLKEDEEVIIRIECLRERLEILKRYRGILGKTSREEIAPFYHLTINA